MTISETEIRLEIKKEVDQLPEDVLSELLNIVRRLKTVGAHKDKRQRSFKRILEEDDGLFRRLAQYDTEL